MVVAMPPDDNDRERSRRERDNEAKTEASQKARDIGPIPEVADPQRRQTCRENFQLFCETYFPNACHLGWSDDHLKVIGRIQATLLDGGLFAFGMPRGSGKTTLCRAAVLHALLYGRHPYLVLVAATEDQAKAMLDSLKRVLLSNQTLAEDFPESIRPLQSLENNARKQVGQLCEGEPTYITWAADRLVFPTLGGDQLPTALKDQGWSDAPASGSIVTVAGLDGAMRGQQHTRMDGTVIRPSLLVLDDPQTRQSAASHAQTRRRMHILNGDVLGMAGPGRKISGFMTCTKIYADDLADQILDREQSPEWQGECTQLVYQFPERDDLWEQYGKMLADGLRAGEGKSRATAFYAKNREAMDKGAVVAWDQRYDEDELSAIQHAMNLWLRDEEAFYAEYQNQPANEQKETVAVSADDIIERVNSRPIEEVPKPATALTAFIDVQERILYWLVAAYEPNFAGYVLAYGAYPDQKRRYFQYREAKRTLRRTHQGAGDKGAIQAGLIACGGSLLNYEWPVAGGGKQTLRIERLLIDAGYLPEIVGAACRELGGVAMPSKGVGIRAAQKPMTAYRRQPGEKHGYNWYIPSVAKTAEVRHVRYDTNHWKTHVHRGLAAYPGDPGALTLYGKSPTAHRMLADHVGSAETATRTEGQGRTVHEWNLRPAKPDNHFFDCLVGSAVAASMVGIGQQSKGSEPRNSIKLSNMRKKAA